MTTGTASHSARDLRHDLARDQLYLAWLVTHWPEVDSLAPRAGITGQQLGALGRRADADPAAELGRVSPDQWSDDPGQDPVGLLAATGNPGPHRDERVREIAGRLLLAFELTT